MAGNCILTAGNGPRQQGLYDIFFKPFLAFQNLEITIDFAHGNLFLHSGIDIWQQDVLIRDIFTHAIWFKISMIRNCLYLDQDITILEEFLALPLEDTFDDIANYCWLPYDGNDVHTSPIQSCIEDACRRTCHQWQGFDDFHIVHAISCVFIHVLWRFQHVYI